MDRKLIAIGSLLALSGAFACSNDRGGNAMTLPTAGGTATAGTTAPTQPSAGSMTLPSATAGTGQSANPQTSAGSSAQPSGGAAGQSSQPQSQAGSPSTLQAGTPQSAAGAGGSAGSAGDMMMQPAAGTMAGMAPATGTLPPVTSVKDMGPFAVTIEMGEADGGGWVAHPTELGKDGIKHPIFLWGCGGGSQPSQYEDHMKLIASHGFIMESHVSSGNASDFSKPLEWLLAQNEKEGSKYYHKLDVTKIAAAGHSMGSVSTFAFESGTDKLTTSIHVAGGSFDGNGFMSLKTPTMHIDGVDDTLAGSNTMRDYERTTVPTFYANIDDTDHIYAARNGLPLMIAWLRWHLAGETERKAEFVGANCEFCAAPYHGMSKNW